MKHNDQLKGYSKKLIDMVFDGKVVIDDSGSKDKKEQEEISIKTNLDKDGKVKQPSIPFGDIFFNTIQSIVTYVFTIINLLIIVGLAFSSVNEEVKRVYADMGSISIEFIISNGLITMFEIFGLVLLYTCASFICIAVLIGIIKILRGIYHIIDALVLNRSIKKNYLKSVNKLKSMDKHSQ
jgi:hypothetical protein